MSEERKNAISEIVIAYCKKKERFKWQCAKK